jgi:hypothetical protein
MEMTKKMLSGKLEQINAPKRKKPHADIDALHDEI